MRELASADQTRCPCLGAFARHGTINGSISYCAVSVNVTFGCPSEYCPSAVTLTVPGLDGSVSTTDAFPVESVSTIRLASVPPFVEKNTVPPDALPPDDPGFNVTDRVIWLPAFAFCLSPVFVNVAGGFPTR